MFLHGWSWGSAALHPRAGSPAEHLGWGARLYAVTRSAGLRIGSAGDALESRAIRKLKYKSEMVRIRLRGTRCIYEMGCSYPAKIVPRSGTTDGSPALKCLFGARTDKDAREFMREWISHPEKVLFPDDSITKGELASYYEAIAPVMLPHIRRRPVTMERYHRGIGAPGFFQKDVSKGFPEWLKRIEVPKNEGTVNHPIVTDTRSLLWLANQNSITIHVWPSRTPNFYKPDICVLDRK